MLQATRDAAVSWTDLRRESEAFMVLDGAEIATRALGPFFVPPANIGARFFAPIIQWFPGRGNTRVLEQRCIDPEMEIVAAASVKRNN